MVDPLAVREMRRALLPLLREACVDPAVCLIAADLIAEADESRAAYLRAHPDVCGILAALDVGCWRCRAVRGYMRGMVRVYVTARANDRRLALTGPENHHEESDIWCPSARERGVGCIPTGEHAPFVPLRFGSQQCRESRHVRMLVWRGLEGHDVPPDIGAGLAVLRMGMLARLYHFGRTKDEKSYDPKWGSGPAQ